MYPSRYSILTGRYFFRVPERNTRIFDKIVRDYAIEQMPDGRFWACSPAAIFDIPEWSMYWPNFQSLKIAAKIAGVLGHATEYTEYETKAAALKKAINTHLLVDGNSYLTKVGSNQRLPLGAAWALRFDIVPPENKAAVAAWIRTQPVNIGGYGGEAFYSGTYSVGGLGDFIVADLNRYKFMLSGNRTNWESFKLPGSGNETNHVWTSYPAYIFPCYISGIQPTGAA